MSALLAERPVLWPSELGHPDAVHPWWCARLHDGPDHQSETVQVGPLLVWATATVTWHTTVHHVGDGPLSEPQAHRYRRLRAVFADPAGTSGR